jgi:hypothetical protein
MFLPAGPHNAATTFSIAALREPLIKMVVFVSCSAPRASISSACVRNGGHGAESLDGVDHVGPTA